MNGEAGGGKGLQRQMTRKAGTVLAENVAGSKAKTGRSMAHLVRSMGCSNMGGGSGTDGDIEGTRQCESGSSSLEFWVKV